MQIDKKQFKVGSLDQLMQMMDEFAKQDIILEASLKRNEGVYLATAEELNQEAKLQIERQVRGGKKDVASIEDYLKNFKWDTHKFPMDKSLKIIGTKILAQQKTCDEKLKKTMDEQNVIRNKLGLL